MKPEASRNQGSKIWCHQCEHWVTLQHIRKAHTRDRGSISKKKRANQKHLKPSVEGVYRNHRKRWLGLVNKFNSQKPNLQLSNDETEVDDNNIVGAKSEQASEVLSPGFSQAFIDDHDICEQQSAYQHDNRGSSPTYDLRSKLHKPAPANPEESSVSDSFIEKLDLFLKEMRQQTNSAVKTQF